MASTSLQNHCFQPKVIFIKRKANQGFGFTLRHFIAYPPETWESSDICQGKAMETIFIKEVHLNGPAHLAGLQTGDRILTVNDEPVAGVPYSVVVQRIKQTPLLLKLEVVSKECDVLQMYYTDIAHNPESNRFRDINKFALLNYVPSGSVNNSTQNNAISRKTLSFPTTTPINHITNFSTNNCQLDSRKTNLRFNDKFSSMGTSNFNFTSIPSATSTLNSNTCDFMARLKKSIEQKEEFLKAVAPQNYPSSLFKTFKSSDNPKRMLSSDKVNNYYALNSMRFSENPKGEDDDRGEKNFTALVGTTGVTTLTASTSSIITGANNDIQSDEQNIYGTTKKDTKLNKAIEKYKPMSPLSLGIPAGESLSLIRVPSLFDNHVPSKDQSDKNIEMKSVNIKNKTNTKGNTINDMIDQTINSTEQKTELECAKSDCFGSNQKLSQVSRRYKLCNINDDNKLMRRISYLRATNNEDGFHSIDTNSELTNVDTELEICDKEKHHECKNITDTDLLSITSLQTDEIISGDMEIKSSIFGKRLTEYRSWRHVKVELKRDILKIHLGRNITKSDTNVIELHLKNYEITEDISSRRKYVFKLQLNINAQTQKNIVSTDTELQQLKNCNTNCSCGNNSGCSSTVNNNVQYTEIYFKTENSNEMKKWIELLKSRMKRSSITICENNEQGKQLAEPQKTAAVSSVSTSEYPDESNNDFKTAILTPSIISSPTTTDINKQQSEGEQQQLDIEVESSLNSVCSPVIKTRKSEKDLGSPKSKNWRGLLFRKGGSGGSGGGNSSGGSSGGNGNQMGASNSRTSVGSIGFPLKLCPKSKDNEYVPYIVEICTKIVESKGLNVTGIYRIPGNKAAISELKNQVNQPDFIWDKINEDVRWEDVNVVSSLLKLFIRSLPDGLLPSTFYNNFIEADKCKGEQKLKEIKYLLDQLPVHSYETLKHIIRHLYIISKNCDVNLMEPKNLAIIFGPSIIRTPNGTLEAAVKDMKHQCCIVELFVSQYEYFFESGALPQLEDNSPGIASSITQRQQEQQQTLLLGNVQKIERKYNDKESVAARFIPHLRRRSKRNTINSDTYSGESILSLECKKSINDQGESSEHGSKEEGGSLEISISLTDEESSNSRISDSGSMSLTTITDTLDSKLRNLRSTSESQSDENDNLNKLQQQNQQKSLVNTTRRNNICGNTQTQQQQQQQQIIQPLILNENIPFADESPERPHSSTISDNSILSFKNTKSIFTRTTRTTLTTTTMNLSLNNNHSNNNNNNNGGINNNNNNNNNNTNRDTCNKKNHNSSNGSKLLSGKHHYHRCGDSGELSCSDKDEEDNDGDDDDDDDSEVSTTSDPKESILISPLFIERYKKRSKSGTNCAYNKLFRSASFNCRAGTKYGGGGNNMITSSSASTSTSTTISTITAATNSAISNLTKDEKTDMNYTKKRQIQNKQNRSIKRRHTVGGPSDYSATITRRTDNDHVLEVGIRIKNVNRRN